MSVIVAGFKIAQTERAARKLELDTTGIIGLSYVISISNSATSVFQAERKHHMNRVVLSFWLTTVVVCVFSLPVAAADVLPPTGCQIDSDDLNMATARQQYLGINYFCARWVLDAIVATGKLDLADRAKAYRLLSAVHYYLSLNKDSDRASVIESAKAAFLADPDWEGDYDIQGEPHYVKWMVEARQQAMDELEAPPKYVLDLSQIPPATQVLLDGEPIGETPRPSIAMTEGDHIVDFSKKYFETDHQLLSFAPDNQTNTPVWDPIPKTRGKAIVKSIMIPGMGQRYYEQRSKGTLFMVSQAASLGVLVIGALQVSDKKDTYTLALDEYNQATDLTQENATWVKLDAAYDDLHDAERLHNTFAGIAIGIYALNLVDMLLLGGPSADRDESQSHAVPVQLDYDGESLGLVFRVGL
jgi:hypothetical protein